MFTKAIIFLCLHMVVLTTDGIGSSNYRPASSQYYRQCGDGMCNCTETVASCQNHGHYNMSYIPRLPSGIVKLFFQNNRLSSLTNVTFQNLTRSSIQVLSLINNDIRNISEGAFSSFTNLQTLCLSGNRIKVINWTAFQYLMALTDLNLSGNKIREMSNAIVLRELIYLNLGGNKIGNTIPYFCSAMDGTSLFPSLITLHMENNYISKLHNDSLQCLHKLRYLGLNGNSIRKLKNNVFSGLSSLRELQLAFMCTSINSIEPYALNNSNIETLNFRENSIVFHPTRSLDIFRLNSNLKTLDISLNNLKKLDDGDIMKLLGHTKKLEKFTATGTRLESIPVSFLEDFENLTDINLDGNEIVNFPEKFRSVKHVKLLSLQGNKIRFLNESSLSQDFLKTVTELNLANNPFSCTCENLWFRSVINDEGMIGNVSLKSWPKYYQCASPADLKDTLFRDYHPTESACTSRNILLIVTISLAVVFIVSAVTVVLGYKYSWYVKYWLYKHKSKRRSAEEEPLMQDNYDAFLIYNPCDSQFIHYDFRLLLEEENAYRLHIWERDVPAGSDNFRGMISGMETSRRVIAIISKDSLDDGWFQFQLSVALDRQVELKRKYLILIILENVECEGLSKYWCVLLTRLPTAMWSHDKTDVKRAAFEQQLFNHLGSRNNS